MRYVLNILNDQNDYKHSNNQWKLDKLRLISDIAIRITVYRNLRTSHRMRNSPIEKETFHNTAEH